MTQIVTAPRVTRLAAEEEKILIGRFTASIRHLLITAMEAIVAMKAVRAISVLMDM